MNDVLTTVLLGGALIALIGVAALVVIYFMFKKYQESEERIKIAKSKAEKDRTCSSCGKTIEDEKATFCPYCGKTML